jgi:pyocin large subunit-like protein
MQDKRLSEQARVAKECRQYLKQRDIKASVTSKSFAGGTSVDIDLIDLSPKLVQELDKYFSKYEYGSFNGMTDSYEYTNSRNDIPQVKYLMIQNKISDDMYKKIDAYILAHYLDTLDDQECWNKQNCWLGTLKHRVFKDHYEELNPVTVKQEVKKETKQLNISSADNVEVYKSGYTIYRKINNEWYDSKNNKLIDVQVKHVEKLLKYNVLKKVEAVCT